MSNCFSSSSFLLVVAVTVIPVGDAIMMSLRAQHKCVLETFVEPKTLVGTWRWVAGVTDSTAMRFEIKDPMGVQLFSSDREGGAFSTFGSSFQFCFTKASGSACRGWKQTTSCNPHGAREPEKDQDCEARIERGRSGYCECQKAQREEQETITVVNRRYFACPHEPFTCELICQSTDADFISVAIISLHYAPLRGKFDMSKVPTSSKVETAIRSALELGDQVQEVRQELEEQLLDDQAFQEATDWLHEMIVWLHVLVLATGLVSGAIQVLFIISIIKLAKRAERRKKAKTELAITATTAKATTAKATTAKATTAKATTATTTTTTLAAKTPTTAKASSS